MSTVYLLTGILASGKSTWAREHVDENTFIVCKDNLREMVYGKYKYVISDEPLIDSLARKLIIELLWSGKNIIIDECWDTINEINRKELCKFIKLYKPEAIIKIIYFSSITWNAVRRAANPHGNIPFRVWKEVEQKMLKYFQPPKIYDEKIDIGENNE